MRTMKIEGNQLTLTDTRFYFGPTGVACPSVTTYLNAYPKGYQYYEWLKKVGFDADEIVTEAGQRGSYVHAATEDLDMGRVVSLVDRSSSMRCSAQEWQMVTRYVDFTRRFKPQHEAIEAQVIVEEWLEAGTIDRIMVLNGKTYLMDIKTSNYIWDTHWIQVAAYKRMWEHITGKKIDGVAILHLNANTRTLGKGDAIQGIGWQLLRKSAAEADELLPIWDAVKVLWRAQNGNLVPKNLTLSLRHQTRRRSKLINVRKNYTSNAIDPNSKD